MAFVMLAASVPLAASARPADVNAQAFYETSLELQAKGMRAMLDTRTRPTLAQMKDAGAYARAANAAASAKGSALYCVPAAERKKGLDAKAALAMLGRVPESQRRASSLGAAWLTALRQTYRC